MSPSTRSSQLSGPDSLMTSRLTLVTAVDCHLCEHARSVAHRLAAELKFEIVELAWESPEADVVRRDGVPFLLALFAPCCVVSLLPTFVGAALERGRLRLPAMAAIFAAGIATVMLPIVLGVGLLGQLLAAQHRVIFFLVGLFLVLLALQVLSGRPWSLPFPMLRLRVSGSTPGGIFALGLTAGVASSCCAPVLAGVVALSALASSVTGALGLGLAYVFGMVFPLLVTVLVWDRVHPVSRGFALRT